MKNATQRAKNLRALLKKLPPAEAPKFPDRDDPVAVLIQSFLLWEATTDKALAGYRRLTDQVVDFNDVRVSMHQETAQYLGVRYPLVTERCQRLRAVLRNIYLREHDVTVDGLREAGKREVKKYFESLEGMVPYVAARVQLLGFDTHAVPVDEQLRRRLVAEDVVDERADVAGVSSWLTRQIKAGEGPACHFALQTWAESAGGRGASRSKKKTSRKTSGRQRPAKKTTSRKRSSGRGSGLEVR